MNNIAATHVRGAQRTLGMIPQRPPGYKEPLPEPLKPIPESELGAILVQGAGSTSDEADEKFFHMREIVALLKQLAVPYIIFSYNGHQNLHYRPWDTLVNARHISKELTYFVSAFPNGRVLFFTHSQGGNLAAFWACYVAEAAQLNRLAGTFFLASPLLQPKPPKLLTDKRKGKYQLWLDAVDGYDMNLGELAETLKERFVVVRCWKDILAPAMYSSFLPQKREKAPKTEIIIAKPTHLNICDNQVTLAAIRSYIKEFLI